MSQPQKPAEAAVANTLTLPRKRIPMSVPMRKMEVPSLDGFYLHWFAEANVPRAIDAGYEMVKKEEVQLNQLGVGAPRQVSGNTDLGNQVSLIGNQVGTNGQPERAYLMKLREEFRLEDQRALETRNAATMQAIFGDEQIAGKNGMMNEKGDLEYVKTALFNRPTRKAKLNRR